MIRIANKTLSEPYDSSQKDRNHANETFSSDFRLISIGKKISYSHDFDLFERDCVTRNIFHPYDFEAYKNLFHKQSVLFYEHSRTLE